MTTVTLIANATDGPTLLSNVLNDQVVFNVTGWEQLTLHIAASGAWPVGFELVCEISLDGSTWSDFPAPPGGVSECVDQANDGRVKYTSLGVKNTLGIVGLKLVRFRTLATGGAVTVTITVNASSSQ